MDPVVVGAMAMFMFAKMHAARQGLHTGSVAHLRHDLNRISTARAQRIAELLAKNATH